MNNASITVPEGQLLNLIEKLGSLAWRKYQQRFPEVWKDSKFQPEDRSGYPPFISFRFENEDPELVAQLKKAVDNFDGAVVWIMGGHKRDPLPGTNWIICPKRFWEISDSQLGLGVSAGKYLAEHDPSFGPIAYDDLLALTKYLNKIF
ncbi:hypothetical protein [Duganella sp. Root1480D1]|uniref:hypothetical protein n=1 Tax=Duganella sp. Root1480D1 TaxID=1736471 RepID=UPI00070AEB18|nr:hypothetical protein [Duganella sp. Root1480D1]KQZ29310.1 hypothetical protein ASD58_30170 [Duganella sp. Root1480D1]